MSNPWLNIPLSDYEGHMESAQIQQLDALSDLFAEALGCCRAASIAVLGIAGGNGLERVDSGTTKRIVGLDINPLYLEEVRRRYAGKFALELHCVDLAERLVNLARYNWSMRLWYSNTQAWISVWKTLYPWWPLAVPSR